MSEIKIVRDATPGEWAAVAGLQLVLELASIRPILAVNRAAGVQPGAVHVAVGATIDLILWLLLVPAVFGLLDRMPVFEPRRRALHLAGWAAVGVAAAAAQAWMVRGLWVAGATWSDDARRTLASPLLSFRYEWETNAPQVIMLLLTYVALYREHRIGRAREAAARLERSLADARLQALSLQIQPHFLFNTLNAIAALVPDDPVTAEAMLVRFGDLLHLTFDGSQDEDVSLETEMTRLALYIDLQRLRFGDRLRFSTHIDPASLPARVPAFLLQPLVENAIAHGIAPRRGVGVVDVDARCTGQTLVLTVRDDGVGLPADAVRHERVGLGSTRARLEAMFPGSHTLRLSPTTPHGTLVTVIVPFQTT
jgi:two-component system, LytTR family, sensor kinase